MEVETKQQPQQVLQNFNLGNFKRHMHKPGRVQGADNKVQDHPEPETSQSERLLHNTSRLPEL